MLDRLKALAAVPLVVAAVFALALLGVSLDDLDLPEE